MATWFECKVKYDKLQDDGASVKPVTETFLVDALSFTEAESRIIEERKPFISGDFSLTAVKRTRISEIFFDEAADRYYMVKWLIVTIDEKPTAIGKPAVEKKTAVYSLVQASTFEGALKAFMEGMSTTMADFEVAQINETPLLDVYPAKHPGAQS